MPATIYKASAGSGKTYTLAQSWLTLALAQPTAYRHILSITFTRKATAEIKDRLLRFLFALAYSPDKQAALRAHLCAHVPCTDEALTQRARQLLSHLLQDYGRLSVHTIDGFFQRIIGAFVAELRLPRVQTLELDTERAARFMTDEVLRQLGHEPHLTRWVVQYAREQLAAGKAWQPDTQLQQLAAQLLSDKHLPFLLSLALSPQQLEALQDRCQQLLEAQHRALALLVQQANATLLAHDLHYDDFYKKYALNPLKALSKQLDNRQRLVFFEPNAHFVQALAGDKPWYAKTAPKTKALAIDTAMASGLHATLQALYTQGADPTSEARQLAITAWLVQQSLFRLGLYDYLKLSLDAYKAREGRVQLGEAGQLIARLHAQGQVPFLYEKLGERYTHLFLDEFQDTSTLQWQNLLPLLENALAGGGHALLVGDVKQSIYRFRGGNSTLLREQAVADLAPFAPQERTLAHNYRSLPLVVAFNNTICQTIPTLPYSDKLDAATLRDMLTQVYADALQLPSAPAGGYVQAEVVPYGAKAKELMTQDILDRVTARIATVVANGYAREDIALLVNTNAEGATLTAHLMAQGIPVYTAVGLTLASGQQVHVLIQLLRWLADPEDRLSLYGAAAALSQLRGQPLPQTAAPQTLLALLHPDMPQQQQSLRQLPLYAQVCHTLRLLQLSPAGSPQDAYLSTLLDLVHTRAAAGDSLADFLRFYDEEGHKRAIALPPQPGAVQVLTIHKAKGLEFPVVILPFADWSLARNDSWLWAEGQPPFADVPYLPLPTKPQMAESHFAEAYASEQAEALLDKVNSLYVAITRAAEQLHLFIPYLEKDKEDDEDKGLRTAGQLLFLALQQHRPQPAPHTLSLADYRQPDGYTWVVGNPARIAAPHTEPPTAHAQPLQPQAYVPWQQVLRLRNRSPLGGRVADAQARGELLHLLLARVRHASDLPQVLAKARHEGLIGADAADALAQQLHGLLNLPQVAPYFSEAWDTLRELDLLDANGDLHRPDRVCLQGQRAVVLDYKTGQPNPHHAQQVQRYLQALSQMPLEATEGWLLYLDSGDAVRVTLP